MVAYKVALSKATHLERGEKCPADTLDNVASVPGLIDCTCNYTQRLRPVILTLDLDCEDGIRRNYGPPLLVPFVEVSFSDVNTPFD